MAFVSSFTSPLVLSRPKRPLCTTRMGVYEDFYSSSGAAVPKGDPPSPKLFEQYYPNDESLNCAPYIDFGSGNNYMSVSARRVPLWKAAAPPDSEAYAGAPDAALWEKWYPKSRVNQAPHIAMAGSESVAVTMKVVQLDIESVQRTQRADAKFESGWDPKWRPKSALGF